MFLLKMQGEKVWNLVEYDWGPPLILDAQGRSTREIKFKHERDKVANESSEANAKALFSIFNKVCPYQTYRINKILIFILYDQ